MAVAAVLFVGIAYLGMQLSEASKDIANLKSSNAALDATVNTLKGSVDYISLQNKKSEAANAALQALAKNLANGEMDLSVKSLKVVSGGKPIVFAGSTADQGGIVTVASNDGSGSAEISSAGGKPKIGFKAESGADATHVIELASYGSDGFYVQKGPTEASDARTAGAGLRIQNSGTSFFIAQGDGNISLNTSTAGEPAKLSVWSDGTPIRRIALSAGTKDAVPSLSVVGDDDGFSLWLQPDRLSLLAKDGSVTLAAAEDQNGGFTFMNDSTGERRAILTSGTEGHGSLSVYSGDKRSNTFLPVYNLQGTEKTQK